MHLLRLWFGFRLPVDRRAYLLSGLFLALLKYAVEAVVLYRLVGHVYTPLEYLQPFIGIKLEAIARSTPDWRPSGTLYLLAACFNLPFLWVALSMSIRRSVDAGHSAQWGLFLLAPFANLVTMVVLAALPSDPSARWDISDRRNPSAHQLRSALLGVASGMLVALIAAPLAIYAGKTYGLSVFAATPFLMGLCAALVFNRDAPGRIPASIAVSQLAVLFTALAMLLMAIEGMVCIAMAFPIALFLAMLGAIVGHLLAERRLQQGSGLLPALLLLPTLSGVERLAPEPPLREVVTTVEVDAPPEVVWQHVVSFSELTEPPEWFFLAGIAYPLRAEIVGEGVGAVRHCVFSTGPFVEPITAWEPPTRLAFDVTEQPRPMTELSPWGDIAAPHLEGTLTSRRGEFRLVALPGGRTRLEGSTWYTLDMGPQAYWTLWSDALIHRIHERVLEHVARLSQAAAR